MAVEPRVIHLEIVGKDQKALQRYYGELPGWKLDTSNQGGYGMTSPYETGIVVGVGATPPDGSAGHVTGYVARRRYRRDPRPRGQARRHGRHAEVQRRARAVARPRRGPRGPHPGPERVARSHPPTVSDTGRPLPLERPSGRAWR